MVLRHSSRRVVVVAGTRDGANRPSGPTRTFRRPWRVGGDRNGRLRPEPRRYADYRLLLDLRRHPGVPTAFFARPAPVDRGFRGFGAWGSVWRARRRTPLAWLGQYAALIDVRHPRRAEFAAGAAATSFRRSSKWDARLPRSPLPVNLQQIGSLLTDAGQSLGTHRSTVHYRRTNSYAPMSCPAPCGRETPSRSIGGALVAVPASIAGDPSVRR
jgi:hypothetical protein